MKKIHYTLLFLIATAMVLVSSCKKDSDATTDQVQLLSFGPSGVLPGDPISFIGNNLDKVTEIDLTGAVVPKANFTKQTSTLITIVTPMETQEGFITLKSSQPDIVSKTKLSFKVPVVVQSMTEQAKPGTNVTIKGEFLNWVETVQFAPGLNVKTFVSQSLGELVVTVPQNAKTGSLILLTGGTKPLSIETDKDLVVTLPAITSLAPNPIAGGDTLIVTGTDLDLVKSITFKGVADPVTAFVSQKITEIKVVFPATANKGKISVNSFSGVTVESGDALDLIGGLPPLAALKAIIFDDALENGFGDWGYGGTTDKANTENVREGTTSVKKSFNGSYDAVRFAGSTLPTTGISQIAFSVFGGPGMGGQKMNLIINNNWGIKTFTVTEGEWVEITFSMDDLGNPASIDDWGIQAQGQTGYVYIDQIGIR